MSEAAHVSREIRLCIVDDHEMLIQGVALALDREPDVDVVGTALTRSEGLAMCKALEPDVVLIDYRINGDSGVDLAHDLDTLHPRPAIIGMSAMASTAVVDAMVAAGCASFVHKQHGIAPLAAAVRAAHQGIGHLPTRAGDTSVVREPLSQRELEVLQSMSEGHAPADIAGQLHLSVHTVRNHVREIRRKLGVTSQLAAVAEGIRHGLIRGPEVL